MRYRCVIFDLDGTLVDSRADLTTGVNLMLAELGRARLPTDRVMSFIGEGVRLLVERALQASQRLEPQPSEIDRAVAIFRRHYREHLLDETRPFPEVLDTLESLKGVAKAVVTNKPYDFSLAILEGLGLLPYFITVLGGDSLPERKPAAQPLLEAARRCQAAPAECLMVGDSSVDIQAGRAAHMTTCGYVGGFRGRAELVAAGADLLIERFSDLLQVVGGREADDER